MLADILITILLIASTFYLTIVLLRFLLQSYSRTLKILVTSSQLWAAKLT